MTPEIEFAYRLIMKNLQNGGDPTSEGLTEMARITCESGENNYSTLLEHCKAINSILTDAIEQMERITKK